MGVAVSGMHYTGMAALHMWPVIGAGGMNMTGGGATAESFLLPLVIGISIVAFIMTATIALSPSGDEMREDAELMERIEAAAARNRSYPTATMPTSSAQARPGPVVSRGTQARRHASKNDRSQ
jgi:hypothetical protein